MKGSYAVFIGACDMDEYYSCERWPALGDKALVRYMESKVGGMIANAASIYSAYGTKTHLLSVFGTDANTSVMLEDLRRYGIDTGYIDIVPNVANGKTHIMLSGNERTIFVVVNPDKPALKIDDRKRELLRGADFVYTTMTELRKLEGYPDLIGDWKRSGVRLAMDVESEMLTGRDEDELLLQAADVLFMNGFAFEKFSEDIGEETAFMRLLEAPGKVVAVTLGAHGCLVRTETETVRIEGIPVKPVDTTGAGDTFNASFLYGLGQRWDVLKTATFANGAATRSTLYFGPKTGIAPIPDILDFIDRGPANRS